MHVELYPVLHIVVIVFLLLLSYNYKMEIKG